MSTPGPASSEIPVDVVNVFTNEQGGHGNPLGLVRSTAATRGREQEIATRLGFSETVFLDETLETDAAGRVAAIRIFTPVHELPFAGHPCVGAAWWLAQQGRPVTALRVPAGDVSVRYDGGLSWITGRPEWAPEFQWHERATAADVEALDPAAYPEGKHYAWAWIDETAGHLRSRMFAPEFGIPEDEATGAAAVRITAMLGRDLVIDQGAGSRLVTRMEGEGRVSVGGRSVSAETVVLS